MLDPFRRLSTFLCRYVASSAGFCLFFGFSLVFSTSQLSAQSCALPFTDSFNGASGTPLSSCWAPATFGGNQMPQQNGSGSPVSSSNDGNAMVLMSTTTPNYQTAEVVSNVGGGTFNGGFWGPMVRSSASGNGYMWVVSYGNLAIVNGGSVGASILSCPPVSAGDTIALTANGSTITCTNVTTGLNASLTDSTYTSGYTGLNLTSGPDMSHFQALAGGLSPSCSLPFTDNFTGAARSALSPCWMPATYSGNQVPQLNGSGSAISPVGSANAMTFLATPTSSFQTAEVRSNITGGTSSGGFWGPMVRGSTNGNGYMWVVSYGNLAIVTSGAVGSSILGCPAVGAGDQIALTANGSTISCTNITTGLSSSTTDSTYSSGYTGINTTAGANMGTFKAIIGTNPTVCPLPFIDSFSSTAGSPLSSCWTTATFSGNQAPVQDGLGAVISPSSSAPAMAVMTTSTPNYQTAEIVSKVAGGSSSGGFWGPIVRGSTSGDGYMWVVNYGNLAIVNNGAVGSNVLGCPTVSAGDDIALTANGPTITCTNVTTGANASLTDATYSSGYAGIYAASSSYISDFRVQQGGPSASCSLPFGDDFTGSAGSPLSNCWTTSTFTGNQAPIQDGTGAVQSPIPSANAMALLTTTTPNHQVAQVVSKVAGGTFSGGFWGPVVRGSIDGNGYIWVVSYGDLAVIDKGNVGQSILGCPAVAMGDTITLSADNTTVTCQNVTTGASASTNNATYGSGYTGIYTAAGPNLAAFRATGSGSSLALATTSCPAATQYVAYPGCTIAASGGTPPYTYAWSTTMGDALVEGLTLDATTGEVSGTAYGQGNYVVEFSATDATNTTVTQPIGISVTGNNSLGSCTFFPSDTIWHTDISGLPVDNSPAAPIPSAYVGQHLHLAFGANVTDGGIPFVEVPSNQPNVAVSTTLFQSYFTSGPIPTYAPIEGTNNCTTNCDRHVLVVQKGGENNSCKLWEMWEAQKLNNGDWTDGSNAFWDLGSYNMLPQATGSADAAGLPIAPLMWNYDEVAGGCAPGSECGVVKHPERFTLQNTLNYHVWPATAQAGLGQNSCVGGHEDSNYLLDQSDPPTSCGASAPMGEIYRLKSTVANPSSCVGHPQAQVLLTAMRNYGLILVDNGISGALVATPDSRWNNSDLSCLTDLTLNDFEPVNVSSKMINVNSSQIH